LRERARLKLVALIKNPKIKKQNIEIVTKINKLKSIHIKEHLYD